MSAAQEILLAATGVSKAFGSFYALKGVDFELVAGEIHALFGANGAGKSTLAKVICGHHAPTAGTLQAFGKPVSFHRPRDAMDAGIGIVTQETSLAGDLSVWENIVLPVYGSRSKPSRSQLRKTAAEAIERLGFAGEIDIEKSCEELSAAHRQLVEIARIVALGSRIIILDEPTAALSPGESARLFKVMDALRKEGRGLIFVSHRLEEIFAMTDRITILRDGASVKSNLTTADLTQPELIHLMVGRAVETLTAEKVPDTSNAPILLSLKEMRSAPEVRSVSLDVHAGEIVGLGGLVGSGRSELAEALLGLRPLQSGSIELLGNPYRPSNPRNALIAGLGFLPEDRRRQSVVPDFSVRENILLSHLSQLSGHRLRYGTRNARINELADMIGLDRARLDDSSLLNFSGGMQQKALVMRVLLLEPRVLVLDEPTKGVDIGARATIYAFLRHLASEGIAILLISSDFEELLALSHRIVPISDGRSIGTVSAGEINEEQLTLICAPRSSLEHQNTLLSSLAQQFGLQAGWVMVAGSQVLCLTRQGSTEGLSLPDPGIVAPTKDTAIANSLDQDSGHVCDEIDGHQSLLMVIENQRGIGMGSIAVLSGKNRPLDQHAIREATAHSLSVFEEGQLRLRAVGPETACEQ
ncbi:sugar ABC transporter ATP-binding protein [Aliiruegeria sabulilitoris]|uniref:sugar ABC transporter ATP-binding protein n=1 Tax=Aliiruegeria sabulilitoris TaxID=1510458 RepID=UPI0008309588|nr:sugar ABC transporter ATP-binding protein [Aliiruegeria sabulilitoris]NDR58864.1 sugar ABC transporter ATP-binding protein [Pseudoruegeria sp. M32A2M]